MSLYSDVPVSVINSAMTLLRALDRSGRQYTTIDINENDLEEIDSDDVEKYVAIVNKYWSGGRKPSVRDLFKLLSRISNGMCFEKNSLFVLYQRRNNNELEKQHK